MKSFKLINIVLLVFLLGSLSAYSQITIGNGEETIEGALLQIKNKSGVTTEADNATKGVAFPRVALTHKNDLMPMIPSGANSDQKRTHVGLVVYNTTEAAATDISNFIFRKGLYVWTNTNGWESVASPQTANGISQTAQGVLKWGGTLTDDTTKIVANNKTVLFELTNVGSGREEGMRIKGMQTITSNALSVVADVETGKLGYGTVTPAELAFYQSGTETPVTSAMNSTSLSVPTRGYNVVPWNGNDAASGGDRITNTGIVTFNSSGNYFEMEKEAMVEISGMIGYRGNNNNADRTIVVNSTIQIRKAGLIDESDWKDYSSVRGVFPADVSGYRNTLSIPPAMADLEKGDQIRMIVARAPDTSSAGIAWLGANHDTVTGTGIVKPWGTEFSKMLKIIVQ